LDKRKAIEAKYSPAQVNDEGNDLTAAGAVIDLLKDDLLLSTTTQGTDGDGSSPYRVKPISIYKNGKFQRSALSKLMSGSNYHSLVAGDKCWLIGIDIKDDGAVLEFLSDPINGVRFKGSAKYPFPKGQIPAADAVLQQIAETISAEPIQNAPGTQHPSAPAAGSAPTTMAAIPPPPQPSDAPVAAPKSISLGQTKAQVTATFGPPTKVVTLPSKEIDYFADMKVTFVKGKVVDVQ
jgi:hypothetical protein